jgi:hypothetical protein
MEYVYSQIMEKDPRWEINGTDDDWEARRLVREEEVDNYTDTDSDEYD